MKLVKFLLIIFIIINLPIKAESNQNLITELKKGGKLIGKVTSAVYSPRLKKNIALAMVEINFSNNGTNLEVTTHEGKYNSTVVEKPFYDPKKKIASS